MGNHYTSITLKGVDPDLLVDTILRMERLAAISPPENDCVVVFDAASESQNLDTLTTLASELSEKFDAPALAVLNHDDDILSYWLYMGGRMIDRYDSCDVGEYFGGASNGRSPGNPSALIGAFASSCSEEEIEGILKPAEAPDIPDYGALNPAKLELLVAGFDPNLFAVQRHISLCEALGLPTFAASGFNYVKTGDSELDIGDLIFVGPNPSL